MLLLFCGYAYPTIHSALSFSYSLLSTFTISIVHRVSSNTLCRVDVQFSRSGVLRSFTLAPHIITHCAVLPLFFACFCHFYDFYGFFVCLVVCIISACFSAFCWNIWLLIPSLIFLGRHLLSPFLFVQVLHLPDLPSSLDFVS